MKIKEIAIFSTVTIGMSFAAYLLPIPRAFVLLVMVLVPMVVAVMLTWAVEGRKSVQALLSQAGRWKVSAGWYAAAIGLAFLLRLAVSLVGLSLGWISNISLRPWSAAQMAAFIVFLFLAALPEEIGWRGYLLPRLLSRFSLLLAGLTVGLLWGVVHLALHLPGMEMQGLPPLSTLLQLMALSVILSWFYVRSGGSVFLTSLFHAAQSFFVILNEGITLEQQALLFPAVCIAAAALIILLEYGVGKRSRAREETARV